MKKKVVFIIIPFLLISSLVIFLFRDVESPTEALERIPFTPHARAKTARLKLHPLSNPVVRETEMKRSVATWDEWVEQQTEIGLGVAVEYLRYLDTPEAIAKEREEIREALAQTAAAFKLRRPVPPSPEEMDNLTLGELLPSPPIIRSRRHEGPQTTEALMESFDANYVRITPQTADWDTHYPREEWIQMLLDKGVRFENRSDYDQYLDMRGFIIAAESRPDWWEKGFRGVPPTDNFEDYKNGWIERRVFQQETFKRVQAEDPDMVSLMWPSGRSDKYLVMKGNRLYVQLDPIALGGHMWGKLPTDEERWHLVVHGTLPKDREVIFLDDNYEVISQAEVRKAGEAYLEKNASPFPPGEQGQNFDMMPIEEDSEFSNDTFLGDIEGLEYNEFDADVARAAAKAAAQAEFENFTKVLRQLEEFTNMSDAEIEQMLLQHLPELPTDESIEKQLQMEFMPKHLSPERFEQALDTLHHHGFEEGFRRIKTENPTLAKELENYLRQSPRVPPEP